MKINQALGENSMNSPIKWHGGKHYLASKIVALMPPHTHYVEPYAGSLAVLLAKNPEGVSEVANDLNGALINFWNVIRAEEPFARFQRFCEGTPFSQVDWELAWEFQATSDCARAAWAFFVHCRQSLAGRMQQFAPLSRNRVRRGMNEQAAAWLSAVEGLPEAHARLKRVVIFNKPAINVIRQQDGPQTLFYLDPPYLHETRSTTKEYGQHEMTRDEHGALLALLPTLKGKFMLSGYRSQIYCIAEKDYGWTRHDFELPNNAAGGDTKRRMVESVWCNF